MQIANAAACAATIGAFSGRADASPRSSGRVAAFESAPWSAGATVGVPLSDAVMAVSPALEHMADADSYPSLDRGRRMAPDADAQRLAYRGQLPPESTNNAVVATPPPEIEPPQPPVERRAPCRVPNAKTYEIWKSHGLDGTASDLTCLREYEPEHYEFFRFARENAGRMVIAARLQLDHLSRRARHGGQVCDTGECFAALGFEETRDMRRKLLRGLRSMESCLLHNKPPLQVATGKLNAAGHEAERIGSPTFAVVAHDPLGPQLVLTDRYFQQCSIKAATTLLNQLSHIFLGAQAFFELPHERQCDVPREARLQPQAQMFAQLGQAEQPQREAWDRFSADYLTRDEDLLELLYGNFIYEPGKPFAPDTIDRETLARLYRGSTEMQYALNAANADSWARLIVSLANAYFKDHNFMPLLHAPATE